MDIISEVVGYEKELIKILDLIGRFFIKLYSFVSTFLLCFFKMFWHFFVIITLYINEIKHKGNTDLSNMIYGYLGYYLKGSHSIKLSKIS